MSKTITEITLGLEQFLLIISTTAISYDEISPTLFSQELFQQLEAKKLVWENNYTYVPNIIHIFVPTVKPKKIQDLETIFATKAFYQHIYSYIQARGYKLFDFLRTEIDLLPGVASKTRSGRLKTRCMVRLEWPNSKQSPSGFDVMVEANASRIIKVGHPKIEVSPLALLQTVNARAFREHYLIVKPVTYLGRSQNVFSAEGVVQEKNHFAFSRTGDLINKSISRRHACIEVRDGKFFLKDCNSRRGTAIQRFKQGWQEIAVPPNDIGVALADHDIIRLGNALVTFEHVQIEQLPDLLKRLFSEGHIDTGMLQDTKERQDNSQRTFTKLIKYFDT